MPDPNEAIAIVRDDLAEGLSAVLPDADGFQVLEGFESIEGAPIANFNADHQATIVAVPWQWTGVHRGELLGIAPTGRVLRVRGVTLVEDAPEEPSGLRMHRYIDWAATLEELGVRFYERRVVDVRERAGEERFLEVDHFRRLVEEGMI